MRSVSLERILYCDTDGFFLLGSDDFDAAIACGSAFGKFKDELNGDQITEFFCAASKTYAYRRRSEKEVFKAKAVTINSSNSDIFSLDDYRAFISGTKILQSVQDAFKIFRINLFVASGVAYAEESSPFCSD